MIPPVGTTIPQHATPEGLAVNQRERIRLRAIREGKARGFAHQQTLEQLSRELSSMVEGEVIEHV